jgi:hypothetical protein
MKFSNFSDPDYVNDVSEKDQRWGSKEIVPPKKTGERMKFLQHLLILFRIRVHPRNSQKSTTTRPKISNGYLLRKV